MKKRENFWYNGKKSPPYIFFCNETRYIDQKLPEESNKNGPDSLQTRFLVWIGSFCCEKGRKKVIFEIMMIFGCDDGVGGGSDGDDGGSDGGGDSSGGSVGGSGGGEGGGIGDSDIISITLF